MLSDAVGVPNLPKDLKNLPTQTTAKRRTLAVASKLPTGPARKWIQCKGDWIIAQTTEQIEKPTGSPWGITIEEIYDKNKKLLETPSNWTPEETDYLVHLALTHELRWPIIHDRYDYEPSRSVEDLKERFYQVCQELAKLKSKPDQLLKCISETYDPITETKKKELAQAKYDISSDSKRREDLIKIIMDRLQDVMKKNESKAAADYSTKSEDDVLLSDDKFAQEIRHLEKQLYPIINPSGSALYKHKGAMLASQILKQPADVVLASLVSAQQMNLGLGSKTKTGGSSVSGRPINPEIGHFNIKDVADASEKVLKTVCKEWEINALDVLVSADDVEDPKNYYNQYQTLGPSFPSRETIEAYTYVRICAQTKRLSNIRLEASVYYLVKRQSDRVQELYDQWVAKLTELRKTLRASRRSQTRPPPTNSSGRMSSPDLSRWRAQRNSYNNEYQ